MAPLDEKYGQEAQKVSSDTPLEDILYLLKRDGGVFVKELIPAYDVDKAHDECRSALNDGVEWTGDFFPSISHLPIDSLEREPQHLLTLI